MSKIGQIERATESRIVALLQERKSDINIFNMIDIIVANKKKIENRFQMNLQKPIISQNTLFENIEY